MENFLVNEKNKALYDQNFVKTVIDESDDSIQSCGEDGVWRKAEPLNDDPEIQEYGAIVDILKNGYLNKDYKVYQIDSEEPVCFVSKERLQLYDVVLLIDGWELFKQFVVFMGTTEENTKYLFKYELNDSIKNYKPNISK
jgi:hypothetical protein